MTSAATLRVGPGHGATVEEVLARMGDVARGAVDDGRAFINGRRAAPGDPVREGDEIAVWAAHRERAQDRGAAMNPGALDGFEQVSVLSRRGEIVVAYKPALLPTTPDRRGTRSLITELAALLGLPDPPHAASRLDVGVSGAVLCATGRCGARHIARQRDAGRIARVYVGIAGGTIVGNGVWDTPIGRARGAGGRAVPTAAGAGARAAATRFEAVAHTGSGAGSATLLRLSPLTGRTHQIRVHTAHAGAPLLGDREHGGRRAVSDPSGRMTAVRRIALHALTVTLPDEKGTPLHAVAPIPEELRAIWEAVDGDAQAWAALAQSG